MRAFFFLKGLGVEFATVLFATAGVTLRRLRLIAPVVRATPLFAAPRTILLP